MNTLAYEHNFARLEAVSENRVELSYDLNRARWPWLALPPQNIVLVEKYQYFSSVTASWALGLFPPDAYSALTRLTWECPAVDENPGYGSRGLCRSKPADGGMVLDIDIRTQADFQIAHMQCDGFAFTDRDFKAWRAASRQKALAQAGASSIDYVAPERVGLGAQDNSLISDLYNADGLPCVTALVTPANGFHPNHPFHTGSRDHVNVGHYLDCVLQMARLLLGTDAPVACRGGEAGFMRFTELDVPFEIHLDGQAPTDSGSSLSFVLTQLGRENARITLQLERFTN